MHSPVEEIKNRLSIEEVVGSYIELKHFGKTQKALCPFHQEKTPSFVVSEERQSFYCFGCNKGGDIFTFVQEFEGVDFRGSLKILADRAGVDISEHPVDPKEKEEKNILYEILETASTLYSEALEMSDVASEYVKKRGVTKETALQFRIGFAPESWDFILNALVKKGFSTKHIAASGLIIKKEKGGFYDRFRNRIMFPISDSSGRIIAFSGRTLSSETDIAKYINSPETAVFKKRDVLFGIDKAKSAIRKFDFTILVEGQMDLVLSHQSGFRNTVATSGTALSDQGSDIGEVTNLELAKRLSRNLVVAFDSDKAGKIAAIKNARIAFALGMDVKIAELPERKDPADVILNDKNDWKKIIKLSKDVVEFQLNEIEQKAKTKKEVLKRITTDIFATIAVIPSSLEREHYLNTIAEKMGMRTETMHEEFALLQSSKKTPHTKSEAQTKTTSVSEVKNVDEQEKLYLAALIDLKKYKSKESEQDLITEFAGIFAETPEQALAGLSINSREQIFFEIEAKKMSGKMLSSEIEYLLKRFKIKRLEKEAQAILIKMKTAEDQADKEKVQEFLETYSHLSKEIEALKETK